MEQLTCLLLGLVVSLVGLVPTGLPPSFFICRVGWMSLSSQLRGMLPLLPT